MTDKAISPLRRPICRSISQDGRPQSHAVRPIGGRTDRVEPLPAGLHRPRGRDRPGERRGRQIRNSGRATPSLRHASGYTLSS